MGILQRGSKVAGSTVRMKIVNNTKKKTLQTEIRDHLLAGSAKFTDRSRMEEKRQGRGKRNQS